MYLYVNKKIIYIYMVVFSCLLSVSYTECQSYNRIGHNGHEERTYLSGKQVRSCRRTDAPSWIGDIVFGEYMHQPDRGHSPQRKYAPMGLGTYSSENTCPNGERGHSPQQ